MTETAKSAFETDAEDAEKFERPIRRFGSYSASFCRAGGNGEYPNDDEADASKADSGGCEADFSVSGRF